MVKDCARWQESIADEATNRHTIKKEGALQKQPVKSVITAVDPKPVEAYR